MGLGHHLCTERLSVTSEHDARNVFHDVFAYQSRHERVPAGTPFGTGHSKQ